MQSTTILSEKTETPQQRFLSNLMIVNTGIQNLTRQCGYEIISGNGALSTFTSQLQIFIGLEKLHPSLPMPSPSPQTPSLETNPSLTAKYIIFFFSIASPFAMTIPTLFVTLLVPLLFPLPLVRFLLLYMFYFML